MQPINILAILVAFSAGIFAAPVDRSADRHSFAPLESRVTIPPNKKDAKSSIVFFSEENYKGMNETVRDFRGLCDYAKNDSPIYNFKSVKINAAKGRQYECKMYRGEMCRVNPFLKPVTLRFSKSLARLENEDHRKGGFRSFECKGAKK